MAHRAPAIPVDLRARLEAARLDLLALFRALDRMDLSAAEIPQRLIHQLFELDTLAALEQLPDALVRFRKTLPQRAHSTLPALELSVRKTLDPLEAYNMVPGRDPHNG